MNSREKRRALERAVKQAQRLYPEAEPNVIATCLRQLPNLVTAPRGELQRAVSADAVTLAEILEAPEN
jgi:hypothetical protein